jgi:hypothetical protein
MEARKLRTPRSQPFQLSLRIRHPSLDPADISRELEIEAEHSFRAGEPRRSRSGIAPASVHSESYWLGALNPFKWPADIPLRGDPRMQLAQERLRAAASSTLGWALALSARQFFSAHAESLRRIGSGGGQISLLVTLSPAEVSSFSLAPDVSRILSDLGITVEFEFAGD